MMIHLVMHLILLRKLTDRKGEIVENELRAIVGQVENKENSTKVNICICK